jgi:hypothetical protein
VYDEAREVVSFMVVVPKKEGEETIVYYEKSQD